MMQARWQWLWTFANFTLLLPLLWAATAFAAGTVNPCTEASLRAALSGGGTVSFACDGTITLAAELVINTDTVIDGTGRDVVLSGNGQTRILRLVSTSANPRSLTVRHLTLERGRAAPTTAMPNAARGGAIMTEHQGVLVVENVLFQDNVAADGGGAIYGWFEGSVTVSDSEFRDNLATAGNDERGAGGIAFHGPGPLTVRGSHFEGNRGINGAAINSLNGRLTVEDSTFINNDTRAAFFDTGQPNAFLRGRGGAIYTDRASSSNGPDSEIIIRRSLFQGNEAEAEGGAAYLYTGTQDAVLVEDSRFIDNQVFSLDGDNGGGSGGAITQMNNDYNRGFTVHRSLFENNRAVNDGGAIRLQWGPMTLTNSTFQGNRTTTPRTASYTGGIGGALGLWGDAEIRHVTFADNHATWTGGAITANNNYTVTVTHSLFVNNTADNGTNPWGIQQHTGCNLSGSGNVQTPDNGNDCANAANATTLDPQLQPLADNGGPSHTMALADTSPVLNTVSSQCPETDQRGEARDTPCDPGAFEHAPNLDIILRNGFE